MLLLLLLLFTLFRPGCGDCRRGSIAMEVVVAYPRHDHHRRRYYFYYSEHSDYTCDIGNGHGSDG